MSLEKKLLSPFGFSFLYSTEEKTAIQIIWPTLMKKGFSYLYYIT